MTDDQLKEALARMNAKPWRQWLDLVRIGLTEPRKSRAATVPGPIDWRGFLLMLVLCVTVIGVFAWSLVDMFGGIQAGDPLAPFMALGAVIVSAALAIAAGGSVAMFFTQD